MERSLLSTGMKPLKEGVLPKSVRTIDRNLNRFEEDFKNLVQNYVGDNGSLVIFIDDLDRCLPTEALTVLEALKLYLDRANCIFFIGLDRRTIEQAVNEKYSSLEITGKDYIEKMIQLNFFIPENGHYDIIDLFQGDMNVLSHHVDSDLWSFIGIATGQNLRRIKQYLLAWNLVKELLPNNLDATQLQEMAVFLLFQMYFPEFYHLLPTNNYNFMERFVNLYVNDNQRDFILEQHSDLKDFWVNDSLRELVQTTFCPRYVEGPKFSSEPDRIRKAMSRLSAAGQRSLEKPDESDHDSV